jgi:hypothetical protein
MPRLKLIKRTVENLKAPDPSGKQILYWDTELRGFGVLVSGISETKSWVIQAKLKTGRTRRITIAPVNVLSLDEAREEAKLKLGEIYRGGDPKETAQRRARAAITVGAVLDDYLAASPNLNPKTIRIYRASAALHLAAWLDRPLRTIGADEVESR